MNKFLLASMAFALACGPVSAQLQMKQISPVAQKSDLFPQGKIKLTDKMVLPVRETRAGENTEVPLSAKYLSNMGGWDRNIYSAKLDAQKDLTLKVATFYDPVLVARFDGNKITKINTVIGPNMKNLKAFIMDAQTGEIIWEGKKLPSMNNTTAKSKPVSFKCDYVIDKNVPIVVGYEITTKTNVAEFSIVNNVVSNGFLLDIVGDKNEGFQDIGAANGVAAYIDCETEGNAGLKENDVVVLNVMGGRVPTSSEYNTVATFINYGVNPISSLSTSYVVNDNEVNEDVNAESQSFPYMAPVQLNLKAMSPSEAARYLQNFSIVKVNGVADEYTENDVFSGKPDNLTQNILTAISKTYPRKVVMEQFTGTWCGWCPRGHVAMEKAAKAFPDDFIGIAVHAGDDFMIEDYLPLLGAVGSFPSAMLNRLGYQIMDPYYGSQGPAQKPGESSGDILNDIAAISKSLTEAQVGVSSKLEGTNVEVSSVMNFSLPTNGNFYSVAYVLLDNGLQGVQANYYNKDFQAQNNGIQSADEIPEEDLRFLFNEGKQGQYVATFDHVAVAAKDALGLEGSLQDVQIQAGVPVKHEYSIPVPATVKDASKLEVVALLIDNLSGEIVNAAKAKVGETSTGVENVVAESAEIVVANGVVHVKGNGVVSLYTADGKLVKQQNVKGSVSVDTVGLKGVYVIRVVDGNNVTVKKVML